MRQNGAAITLTTTTAVTACTYNGSYSCTSGVTGSFQMFDMAPMLSGFTGRFAGQNQYCQFSGYFGGVRRAI